MITIEQTAEAMQMLCPGGCGRTLFSTATICDAPTRNSSSYLPSEGASERPQRHKASGTDTSPELNPQENIWDEIREKIFKNYALKSMSEVNAKLDEAALYIERNPPLVKSISSFSYIAKSL
jgi:hypothetical protein